MWTVSYFYCMFVFAGELFHFLILFLVVAPKGPSKYQPGFQGNEKTSNDVNGFQITLQIQCSLH